MTENTKDKVRRKPRPKYDPRNKEQASNKKRRWKKHYKKPKKDLGQSLKELQEYFHRNYNSDYNIP